MITQLDHGGEVCHQPFILTGNALALTDQVEKSSV